MNFFRSITNYFSRVRTLLNETPEEKRERWFREYGIPQDSYSSQNSPEIFAIPGMRKEVMSINIKEGDLGYEVLQKEKEELLNLRLNYLGIDRKDISLN